MNSLISTCSKQHIKVVFVIVGMCKMYFVGQWLLRFSIL